MKMSVSNGLLVLVTQVAMAGAIFAQSGAAPLYPANPHPDQAPNPSQDQAPQEMNQNTGQNDMPVFRVTVTERTTKAVNYRNRGGSTEVDFRGTDLMPEVTGHAKVEGKGGRLTIDAEFAHLQPVRMFGGQYLTYVLWAITPDGRAVNLGKWCREAMARTRLT